MHRIVRLLFLFCLLFTPMRAFAGTHAIGGSFAHSKTETTSKFGPFKMDMDQYSDTYSAGYSYYSTDLKENPYPELAILNSHPSYVSVRSDFSRHTSDDAPSLDYSYYRVRGRYSFSNGIGVGSGLTYSSADRSSSGSDSDSSDVSVSLDYSMSPQSNILLQLDRMNTDSDDGRSDSDGYAAYLSSTIAIRNSYIIASYVGYLDQEAKDKNTTDITRYILGLRLGVLFSENVSVDVSGGFFKQDYDGIRDGDSDGYRVSISPKYWFNRSANLSLTFSYLDQSGDFDPSIEMDSTEYSGEVAFEYRF